MKPQSPDTSPETEMVLIELVRRAPVWKRVEWIVGLTQACRMLTLADIGRRYPQASEEELHKRLAARLLSREEVIRAYDWDPEKEGY